MKRENKHFAVEIEKTRIYELFLKINEEIQRNYKVEDQLIFRNVLTEIPQGKKVEHTLMSIVPIIDVGYLGYSRIGVMEYITYSKKLPGAIGGGQYQFRPEPMFIFGGPKLVLFPQLYEIEDLQADENLHPYYWVFHEILSRKLYSANMPAELPQSITDKVVSKLPTIIKSESVVKISKQAVKAPASIIKGIVWLGVQINQGSFHVQRLLLKLFPPVGKRKFDKR